MSLLLLAVLSAQSPQLTVPQVDEVHRVVVQPIRFEDPADERLARILTDALVTELRKLEATTVVAIDEIKAMMGAEAERQLAGCETDSCLSEIVDALGANGLVIGQVVTLNGERVFSIKRIDQAKAKTMGQVNQRLKLANGEECLAMIGPAVKKLYPATKLREGETRGVANEIALLLNPPPLDPWVFWTGSALTGVAVVMGISATALNLGTARSLEEEIKNGTATADGIIAGSKLLGTTYPVLITCWASAAALAATTGVVALNTDFEGYGDVE